MNDKIWTKEYFEKEFEYSDPWLFFSSEYEQIKYEHQITLIKERKTDPEKILEIGCAEGAHTNLILDFFPKSEIIGIDISSKAIERAKNNIKNKNVHFVETNILDYVYQIPDQYFDVIVWSESVYYIGDLLNVRELLELFNKITNKLRTGGILCMANIINQFNAPETPLTKKPIMDCYLLMMSSFVKLVEKKTYFVFKNESNRENEYQIWVFEKQ